MAASGDAAVTGGLHRRSSQIITRRELRRQCAIVEHFRPPEVSGPKQVLQTTAIPAGNGNSFSFATVRSTGYATFRSVTAPSCQTAYEASGPPSLGCPRLPGLTTVRVPSRLTNGKCVWLTRMTSASTDADSCLHAGESGRQYENNGSDGVASHKNNRWPSRSTDAVSGRSRRKRLSSSGKHLHMCAVWITFYPVAGLKRSEAWWAHWARGVVILFAFMLAQRYFR